VRDAGNRPIPIHAALRWFAVDSGPNRKQRAIRPLVYDRGMSGSGNNETPAGETSWDTSLTPAVRGLADELMPLFYDDLKRLAHRERSRVSAGVTLQTTALVNEAYLKLRGSAGWHDDAHFLRAAALAMRHALVNHALARLAAKRGDGAPHLSLTAGLDVAIEDDATLVALDEALARLARESLRLAQVVECRYFGGYDDVETARALGVSERTVRRDWSLARAWLHRELAAAG
jgi:RNA polymerase sigma factor (TIGR02999 family)